MNTYVQCPVLMLSCVVTLPVAVAWITRGVVDFCYHECGNLQISIAILRMLIVSKVIIRVQKCQKLKVSNCVSTYIEIYLNEIRNCPTK